MWELGALTFTAPPALAALASLPVIWWLLRLTPPAPTRVRFPPLRLLLGLVTREEPSSTTPLWLIILRLAIATILILAASGPLWDQSTEWQGKGPMLLVVDDGWSAAPGWPDRQRLIQQLTDQAGRDGRPVHLLSTASPSPSLAPHRVMSLSGRNARELAAGLQPRPWPSDRPGALKALAAGPVKKDRGNQVIWLSDGLDHGGLATFAEGLAAFGPMTVVVPPASRPTAKVVRPPVLEGSVLVTRVERADATHAESGWLRAYADDGRLIVREAVAFKAGDGAADLRLDLPGEMLNRLGRVSFEGEGNARDHASAAAVALLDERWRRRPIGIVTGDGKADLPLLSSVYYLNRAMEPFSEVRQGTIAGLLDRRLAMMALPDPGTIGSDAREKLEAWISEGGVAVRFAGPLLAQATSADAAGQGPLVPVPLRTGDRVIGGAMSWTKPAKLAPFEADSPFQGLKIPGDVVVNRQVLARPAIDIENKTWARLADGTPLVTAEKRGKGWLILFHTTANTQWSNLALSGLLVEMMQRLVGLSQGVTGGGKGPPLEPIQTLDAFGVLKDAPPDADSIAQDKFADTAVSPRNPPGIYAQGSNRRVLNLSRDIALPAPMGDLPVAATRVAYGGDPAVDIRPALMVLALALALIDYAVSLWLRGVLRLPRLAAPAAMALMMLTGATSAQQVDDAYALENSTDTRLAYVVTGNDEVDRVSRMGLSGLSLIVRRRTAAELAEPRGVELGRHDLGFFPLIYWPVTAGVANLSERARQDVNAYLQNGGTILFDTRSQGQGADLGELRELARRLDIPPLVPAAPNHVLSRAFYLLNDFPGRWRGGALWIERAGERINDGVSPVIAGSNDWAAAWAIDDETSQPILPAVPGGERQRELAYRFGVNLVMYVLTGNYKADQVHLPAIMRRLGQ
ncbi:MAG: DUF4159 domain-containing protein [Rhodospirillaceae bacterium]